MSSVEEILQFLKESMDDMVKNDDQPRMHDLWDTLRSSKVNDALQRNGLRSMLSALFGAFHTVSGSLTLESTVAGSYSELPVKLLQSEGDADLDIMIYLPYVACRNVDDSRPL